VLLHHDIVFMVQKWRFLPFCTFELARVSWYTICVQTARGARDCSALIPHIRRVCLYGGLSRWTDESVVLARDCSANGGLPAVGFCCSIVAQVACVQPRLSSSNCVVQPRNCSAKIKNSADARSVSYLSSHRVGYFQPNVVEF
jgi:hypothetical protein